MKRRWCIGLLGLGMIVAASWVSTLLIAVVDRAYICENTGSRKGHREWLIGIRTDTWYHQSELERFMRAQHPDLLQHRWTNYLGSGRSLIGGMQSCRHGRPGPIIALDPGLLDAHTRSLTDDLRLGLYNTFASANKDAAQRQFDSIIDGTLRDSSDISE